MRIILLTQYYPPETGAPQNRLHNLAVNLKKCGNEVEVFTGMPNYPKSEIQSGYKGRISFNEEIDGVKINRSWIYVTKSSRIVMRLMNYFSFCVSSFILMIFRMRKGDFIICESPPLFLGLTAVLISRLKRTPLVFNVSDLWPKSAEELGLISNKTILGMTTWLEEWIYKKSKAISGQTQGISADIQKRFPNKPIHWLPNGADEKMLVKEISNENLRSKFNIQLEDFVVGYAGIIGHAQGLEIIIEAAEKLKNENVKFLVAGSGPVLPKLEELKADKGLKNVIFMGSFQKSEMAKVISTMDAAFIPLKKSPLFMGAIPSKIFENCAYKKPLILGVDGEAKELFINQGKSGLFYEPENSSELCKAIITLKESPQLCSGFGENGRKYVSENFNRADIAVKFFEFLKNLKR